MYKENLLYGTIYTGGYIEDGMYKDKIFAEGEPYGYAEDYPEYQMLFYDAGMSYAEDI